MDRFAGIAAITFLIFICTPHSFFDGKEPDLLDLLGDRPNERPAMTVLGPAQFAASS